MLRIAMLSTPAEATPPLRYGGTERIVSLLTEGLVRRGHEVTLFATADSQTSARLISFYDHPVRPYLPGMQLTHVVKSLQTIQRGRYDLIHNHTDFGIGLAAFATVPMVTTLHNNLNRSSQAGDIPTIYESFADAAMIAVSDYQARTGRPYGIHVRTRIYNALDTRMYGYSEASGAYLAFIGLLAPHKGPHHAIRVAQQSGVPLKIAGKRPSASSPAHIQAFFNHEIVPHIDGTTIEFVGELTDAEKIALLKEARALLFPIEWDEPFGLVMIEAMACGTPVIAYNRAAVPEIVQDGVTGFIVEDEVAMAVAIERLPHIDRPQCRQRVVDLFDAEEMIDQYEQVYKQLVGEKRRS